MIQDLGVEVSGLTSVLSIDGAELSRRVQAYRLHVRLPSGAAESREVRGESLRVGSGKKCELVLEDDTVSRVHFEISVDLHGFRLRDLESTNGTFVDGARARDVYLRPQARIRAGRTELVFVPMGDCSEERLPARSSFGLLVGASPPMLDIYARIERVAASETTVLIEGESGTGKELVAAAIHGASRRRQGPLVVFDCSAVPSGLIESELFGHERGAFTGAVARRDGALAEADGGTLFLDEVGELPIELQPKLLRALEQREARAVGGDRPRRFDVRIIAATNRDLALEVNRGTFREDLYYRVAVVRLKLPPLRERTSDVPLLVRSMLLRMFPKEPARAQALFDAIAPGAWSKLAAYPWRGNVRELKNAVERAVTLSPSAAPQDLDLLAAISSNEGIPTGRRGEAQTIGGSFNEQRRIIVEEFERRFLTSVLAAHDGNLARAARAAGLDRSYFKRLLRKYE